MRRIIHFLARLYPARWRKRYGDEFDALLEDSRLDWRAAIDVLANALKTQIMSISFWKIAASLSLLGATGALGWSYRTPVRWISHTEFYSRESLNKHLPVKNYDGRPVLHTNLDPRETQIHFSADGSTVTVEQPVMNRAEAERLFRGWSESGVYFHFLASGETLRYPLVKSKLVRIGPNRLLFFVVGLFAGLLGSIAIKLRTREIAS